MLQAGLGLAGRGGGRSGDPAGVWLRSNPGDYYHWDAHTHIHIHTLAVVFATGVCPDSCGFPGAEVITCSAILHGGLRYHRGCRINCLSSLCEQFLSPRAPEEATGKERDKKAEKMRVNMHG